jgi:hypothetical protein
MGDLIYIPFYPQFNMDMAVCQNLVPLVNIKIAGKWMFIPLKMVLIGIDPYPYSGDTFGDVTSHGAIVHGDDDEIAGF